MRTMADEKDEHILRNLLDAACPDEAVERFLSLRTEGNVAGQIKLLQSHRKILLESIHARQRALDCLDYLIFTINKSVPAMAHRNGRGTRPVR